MGIRSLIAIFLVLFMNLSGSERYIQDNLEDHSHSYHNYESISPSSYAILGKKFNSSERVFTNAILVENLFPKTVQLKIPIPKIRIPSTNYLLELNQHINIPPPIMI